MTRKRAVKIQDLPESVLVALDWIMGYEKTKAPLVNLYMEQLQGGDLSVLVATLNLLRRLALKKKQKKDVPVDLLLVAHADMQKFMRRRWVEQEVKAYYSRYYDRDDVRQFEEFE